MTLGEREVEVGQRVFVDLYAAGFDVSALYRLYEHGLMYELAGGRLR